MSDDIRIETVGLTELRVDLNTAITKAPVNVRKAVEVTARHVKDDARSRAASIGPHAKSYPRSITYDILYAGSYLVQAEIGPDKGGPQGALGNLLEFGSVHNPPHPHLAPALTANEADFERGIALATRDALP